MKHDVKKNSIRVLDRAADQYHGNYVVPTIPGNNEKDQLTKAAIMAMKQQKVKN